MNELELLLEEVYRRGGNYEGPLTPEDFGMCYSDAYINREDNGDGYLEHSLPRSLRVIEKSIASVIHEFDAIVVSGLSGVIPGAIIASKYNKQLVVVRKEDDVTHGTITEGREYFKEGTPYIVLDDFVSSGKTMTRILNKMLDQGYGMPRYLVLYRGPWHTFNSAFDAFIGVNHVGHGLYVPFLRNGDSRLGKDQNNAAENQNTGTKGTRAKQKSKYYAESYGFLGGGRGQA